MSLGARGADGPTHRRPSRVDADPHPAEAPRWTTWFCLPEELPGQRNALLRTGLVVAAITAGIIAIAFLLSIGTAVLVLAIGLGSQFLCGLLGRIADARAEAARRSGEPGWPSRPDHQDRSAPSATDHPAG
ncbi:hypothetical protein [Goodfellowiella coeruleoviolacea]|uniref:Uncharacterized protein n=1 Tax=Goodfellowiella coeruleoviolacea TaxID=334858 RepID=A0AAE3GAW9_9PSEU|nr:hypothetical protein [Goodfellowiella coeruleoviolacea]MCP2164448.1 hypothetical protein [Goodfellowiella coeruleoviolacea]